LKGYEIHHGRTRHQAGAVECALDPLFERPLLTSDVTGRIWGSYLHGLLDNDAFRRGLLSRIAKERRRSYRPEAKGYQSRREAALDRWAAHVERHVHLSLIPGFPAKRKR
jgi:adenosylcobyric acid synthase